MTFTIELRRIGTSRSSLTTIPIVARVKQGNAFGDDLLAGMKVADIENARRIVVEKLEDRFRSPVTVMWLDETEDSVGTK